jgi:hypothetical protein
MAVPDHRSSGNGIVQPDVPMWLLTVGRPQAGALDLAEQECPQADGEEIAGPPLDW